MFCLPWLQNFDCTPGELYMKEYHLSSNEQGYGNVESAIFLAQQLVVLLNNATEHDQMKTLRSDSVEPLDHNSF